MIKLGREMWQEKAFLSLIESANFDRFNELAINLFHFQAAQCQTYRKYLDLAGIEPQKINTTEAIPFLPVEIFKTHEVKSYEGIAAQIFRSSGTGGNRSSHHLKNTDIYKAVILKIFGQQFMQAEKFCFLGLLPSYLEREDSSLVFMVKTLMEAGNHPLSGFYLYNHDALAETLDTLAKEKVPTVLFGVSFALLDFAEKNRIDFPELRVIETGGMKGRAREPIRSEVREMLRQCFVSSTRCGEYGMTELLSHAYAVDSEVFYCPPWMRVIITEANDPFGAELPQGYSGRINIIDLANFQTCSFLKTSDIGRMTSDGGFEVLGRLDYSDLRGCSLMV